MIQLYCTKRILFAVLETTLIDPFSSVLQVVPHEVIEIDDDDPDGVMIIGDKASVDKNKQTVVYPMDWPKHAKVISLVSFPFSYYLPLYHVNF